MIGLLLFGEAIVAPTIIVTQQGNMPTLDQFVTIILVAFLQLISYFLVFLGYKKPDT
jgi:hypothetical protein